VTTEDGGKAFEFRHGPIFGNLVLADEINRATPKTQSAMLEAMQEHSVTSGGQVRKLPTPFMVLATQNPIEQEGTYPLPEAQLDRFFFKLTVGYSNREQLKTILDRTTTAEEPQAEPFADTEKILWAQKLVRRVVVAEHVQDPVDDEPQQLLMQLDPVLSSRFLGHGGADVDVAQRIRRLGQVEGDDISGTRSAEVGLIEGGHGSRIEEGDRDLPNLDTHRARRQHNRPLHVGRLEDWNALRPVGVDDEPERDHDAPGTAGSSASAA